MPWHIRSDEAAPKMFWTKIWLWMFKKGFSALQEKIYAGRIENKKCNWGINNALKFLLSCFSHCCCCCSFVWLIFVWLIFVVAFYSFGVCLARGRTARWPYLLYIFLSLVRMCILVGPDWRYFNDVGKDKNIATMDGFSYEGNGAVTDRHWNRSKTVLLIINER